MIKKLVRIRSVKPLKGFHVLVEFSDGSRQEIDFEPYLHGPIFEPLRRNLNAFRLMRVDPRAGTVVWSNGADIDPDVLYQGLKPAWMQSEQFADP